jgi:hypothetical protein
LADQIEALRHNRTTFDDVCFLAARFTHQPPTSEHYPDQSSVRPSQASHGPDPTETAPSSSITPLKVLPVEPGVLDSVRARQPTRLAVDSGASRPSPEGKGPCVSPSTHR